LKDKLKKGFVMEIYENLDLSDLENEIWKEIEGYDGDYYISNLGRVKSFKNWNRKDCIIIKSWKTKYGYLNINLYKNGNKHPNQIHRLVMETFDSINNIFKLEINHINGIKTDNRLENLEWCTHSENAYKLKLIKYKIGKNHHSFGKYHSKKTKNLMSNKSKCENNSNSKLTEQNIIEIRRLCDEGILTQKEIGELFGVSRSAISRIKRRKTWVGGN